MSLWIEIPFMYLVIVFALAAVQQFWPWDFLGRCKCDACHRERWENRK